jgi:lipoprotein-releasing system permease protein
MVVAMALMTGYRQDLERKLVAGNAAILIYPLSPGASVLAEASEARLRAMPEVTALARVGYGQGTLSSEARPEGEAVTLRGVDPGPDALAGADPRLETDHEGVPGAVLGSDLARRLQAAEGEVLRLVALGFQEGAPRFRYQSLRVVGTFTTGFAEFDRSWIVLAAPVLDSLTGPASGATLYEMALEDPSRAPVIAESVADLVGEQYLVTDWQRLNRELFSALRLQQLMLFFLLGLIVVVSTFNVASTLMVLVRERMREVGVLSALGLEGRRLALVFVVYGGALGLAGTALGVALGSGISWVLTTFELVRFDPEVAAIYFLTSVPFRVQAADVTAVVLFALGMTLLSCLLPAWRVLRVQPSQALRYE